ncbi:MAG TPA: hypothetical protein PKH58_12585 [Paludibacteraceae bacterium]|nr:hypothetical protein [Paludibacteraceae bacterium]
MTKKNIQIEKELSLEVEHEKQVELCTKFLDLFFEPYHKWTISSSYHYKHLVERFFGLGTHISNEAFIISAYKFDSKPADNRGLNFYYKFRLKELSSSDVEKIRKINPDVKLNKKIKNGYYTCYSL